MKIYNFFKISLFAAALFLLDCSAFAASSSEYNESGSLSDFLIEDEPSGKTAIAERTDKQSDSASVKPARSSESGDFSQDITDPMFQPIKGKFFSDMSFVKSSYRINGIPARFLTSILQADISYGITGQLSVAGGIQRVGSKIKNIHAGGRDHYSYKNIFDAGLKFRFIPVENFIIGIQGHYKNVQSERAAGEDTDGIAGAARLAYQHRIANPFLEISYVRDFKESDDVAKSGIMAGIFKDFGKYTGIFNVYRSHLTGSSHLISYGAGVSGHYRFTENMAAGIGTEVHLDSSHAGGAYSEIENAVTVKLLFRALF